MLLNLIPFFLANLLGVRTAVIGLIEGVAETTASLLKIFFGALSDRSGRRKPFAVVGYALSAFTKPLLYFASAWGWVLGVRVADPGPGLPAAIGITVLPASVLAGILWEGLGAWTGFGPSAPFFFGALMAVLAGVLFARLVE